MIDQWVESVSGCIIDHVHPGQMLWYKCKLYRYARIEYKRRSRNLGTLRLAVIEEWDRAKNKAKDWRYDTKLTMDTRIIPAIQCQP